MPASFITAQFDSANLEGVSGWQNALWYAATWDTATIFPEGMNPDDVGKICNGCRGDLDGDNATRTVDVLLIIHP